ncbi:hypothetical protein AFCDBAGC_0085 [Methylobacterium cerastii]|uniref:Uncharacterized protein n=1 Tax=Methylobacterium cerastii TaxID=932741 RepID=A0ABQ4QBR0_9HYPH|nr:hypothetical protein [Methylobacterium cerastii]GJD42250.1 hypothetical protein AFCDBAGC_0085 [Methylobacterium cerastii]
MSNDVEGRFYLTKWRSDGDGETCRLMEREGADDGEDAIVAEFSRYPFPLGDHLAETALTAALAYAFEEAA